MANYAEIKSQIDSAIYENTAQSITATTLNTTLKDMLNSISQDYLYAGVANQNVPPRESDANVFYIAATAGTYPYYGGLTLAEGRLGIFKYNGTWSMDSVEIGSGGGSSNIVFLNYHRNDDDELEETDSDKANNDPIYSRADNESLIGIINVYNEEDEISNTYLSLHVANVANLNSEDNIIFATSLKLYYQLGTRFDFVTIYKDEDTLLVTGTENVRFLQERLNAGKGITISDNTISSYIKVETTIPVTGYFSPNVFYNLGQLTGEVTFNLQSYPTASDEFMIQFSTGDTAPTITWFAGVSWLGGSAPTINANKTYQVSVVNNLAVIGEF